MIIFKGLEMNGHSVEARENDLIVDGKIVPNEILKSVEGPQMMSSSLFGLKAVVGENKISFTKSKVKVNGVKLDLAALLDAPVVEFEDLPEPIQDPSRGVTVTGHGKSTEQTIIRQNGKVVSNEITINGKPVSTRDDYDEFS